MRTFLLILVFFSGEACANFSVAGQCVADTASAIELFNKQFPVVGDTGVTSLTASSIDSSGLITYSTITLNYQQKQSYANNNYTAQLSTCTTLDAIDYVASGAIFTFFFSSIVTLWFAAKNMGLIIAAIRKF